MDKQYWSKLDKAELEKFNDLSSDFCEGKKIIEKEIFGNSIIPEWLKERSSLLDDYKFVNLPAVIPFYNKAIVPICKNGANYINKDILEEYLKRGLVIPVLTTLYSSYNQQFLNLVSKYPHINSPQMRLFVLSTLNDKSVFRLCTDCYYDNKISKINNLTNVLDLDKEFVSDINGTIKSIAVFRGDKELMNKLCEAVKEKNFKKMESVWQSASIINNLRQSNALSSTFIADIDEDVPSELKKNYLDIFEDSLNVLNLKLPENIKLGNYLDLVIDYRKEISNILKNPNPKRIEEDILAYRNWLISFNQEVVDLAKTKRARTLNSISYFLKNNKELIYSGVLKICGVNSEVHNLKVYNSKFKKKPYDPIIDRLLKIYFNKSLPIIQLYRLQKNLKFV